MQDYSHGTKDPPGWEKQHNLSWGQQIETDLEYRSKCRFIFETLIFDIF